MKRFCLIVPLLAVLAAVPALADPTSASKSTSLLALAGYEPLSGEGLVATLSDQKQIPIKGSVVIPGLVHDFDVLNLVNELRSAGARGISVGGIRLTNQSSVRCVGPSILVDGKSVNIPLRIEAVGKAAQLKARLQARGGIADNWKSGGPNLQIKTAAKLLLKPAPLPKSP